MTLMEMYIVLRGCKKYLDGKGILIAAARCGEYLTVQEMAGFQMFAARMDDEMLACWNAPCNTGADRGLAMPQSLPAHGNAARHGERIIREISLTDVGADFPMEVIRRHTEIRHGP